MAKISINLDARPLKVAVDTIQEQVGRLGKLMEELPLDHPVRLFELPLGDLYEAVSDSQMLITVVKGDVLQIAPHPVLVQFGGLVAAICDAIEAGEAGR